MQAAWLLFYFIEAILSMFCIGFNIVGFLAVTGSTYALFCSAIFYLNALVTMNRMLNICAGIHSSVSWEAFVNICATLMYLAASLFTMFEAEKTFYLVYLSSFEKPLHPFFEYSKAQSISALACAIMHLLHAVLALDCIIIKKHVTLGIGDRDNSGAMNPLKLYAFGKGVHRNLEQYDWFQRLNGKNSTTVT